MRKIRRLFCAAAAVTLLCTNTAGAAEVIVEPSPLTGGQQQTSVSSQGPGGETSASVSTEGPGAENAGSSQIALGPGASLSGDDQTQAGSQTQPGNQAQTNGPGGQAQQTGDQSLEGIVFAGSASVAAPTVSAEGAVLLNCNTGQILFEKNSSTQFFPASITKVMTALLTVENCSLDEIVTFSETATTNLESGAVTINLTAGDQLTVEQSLYALLLKSANEVANGLAEHISGSVSAFADLMNQRAAQLGCTGTHFANPNGLNDSTHVTTPYDMALIARAAYANSTIAAISSTLSYQLPATIKSSGMTISMGHKMLYPTDSRYYEGIVAGKTGYTSKAGNTLVACAERNGLRLVAVVMKASGTHYTDTKAMLDYGFALAENGEISTSAGAVLSQSGTGWQQDGNGWYYLLPDGSRAAGRWIEDGGKTYWINGNGYMATGWQQPDGSTWYYFHSDGAMAVSEWVDENGLWYYLGSDGKMLTNTVTPDGYYVGADGSMTAGA